jgi:hypothetical protein
MRDLFESKSLLQFCDSSACQFNLVRVRLLFGWMNGEAIALPV